MTNDQSMKCYKCNHTLDLTEGDKILRHEECAIAKQVYIAAKCAFIMTLIVIMSAANL